MAQKSATGSVANKIPVALFAAALALAAPGVVDRIRTTDARPNLPDPRDMAARGIGRISGSDSVALWATRVADTPDSVANRTKLAGSKLALASQSGDLTLYADAEQVARVAVALGPNDEAAQLTLASALSGQHDFPGALAIADRVLATNARSVAARIAAADARVELGRYDEAFAAFDALAADLGGVPPILSRAARRSWLSGDLAGATQLPRRALIAAGDEDVDTFTGAFYWFQVASFDYQGGRYDTALRSLDAALVVEPDHLGSIELRGKVLSTLGRYDDAIVLYESLLDRTEAADLRGELAKLYERQGRATDSTTQVERGLTVAREQAGKFPAERRHLIGFLADHDPAAAVELARADLALRADVHSSAWLAWSLLRAGNPTEAAQHVDAALRLGTADAWLLYQTGSVLAATGDTSRATELLTRALDLNPQFDLIHADRARQLLKTL